MAQSGTHSGLFSGTARNHQEGLELVNEHDAQNELIRECLTSLRGAAQGVRGGCAISGFDARALVTYIDCLRTIAGKDDPLRNATPPTPPLPRRFWFPALLLASVGWLGLYLVCSWAVRALLLRKR